MASCPMVWMSVYGMEIAAFLLQAKTDLTKPDNSAITHEDNIFNGYNRMYFLLKKYKIVLINAVNKRNIYSFDNVLFVIFGGRIIKIPFMWSKHQNQKDDEIQWFSHNCISSKLQRAIRSWSRYRFFSTSHQSYWKMQRWCCWNDVWKCCPNFEIIAQSQKIHLFYWLIQAILVELILKSSSDIWYWYC